MSGLSPTRTVSIPNRISAIFAGDFKCQLKRLSSLVLCRKVHCHNALRYVDRGSSMDRENRETRILFLTIYSLFILPLNRLALLKQLHQLCKLHRVNRNQRLQGRSQHLQKRKVICNQNSGRLSFLHWTSELFHIFDEKSNLKAHRIFALLQWPVD